MGGLSKHMMHPQDNYDSTLEDLKQIIAFSAAGAYPMKEKIDGFNVHILKNGPYIMFARNQKDLENGGFSGLDNLDDRFSNERVRSIYKKAYHNCMKYYDELIKLLPDFDDVYGDSPYISYQCRRPRHLTLNCEILTEGTTNTMRYCQGDLGGRIIVHGLWGWYQDDEGRWHGEHLDDAYIRATADHKWVDKSYFISECQGIVENDWNNTYVRYNQMPYKEIESIIDKLEHLFKTEFEISSVGLDEVTVGQFLNHRFYRKVDSMPTEQLNELCKYILHDPSAKKLKEIRAMNKNVCLDYLLSIKHEIYEYCKQPLDLFFAYVGTKILERVKGNYMNDWFDMSTSLQKMVNDAIAKTDDRKVLDDFYLMWAACGNKIFKLEGVVIKAHIEGKGWATYKWTGPFRAINKLVGATKF